MCCLKMGVSKFICVNERLKVLLREVASDFLQLLN